MRRCLLLAVLLLVGCAHGPRRLDYGTLESEAMHGADMGYSVYAPQDLRDDERLPLVIFLHGGGDSHASFDDAGMGLALDAALAEGRIPRAVIALPQGDFGFWANWYDGSHRYQDWALEEMLPRVAADYHTAPCPEGCHVMGVSMGGAGTLRFALDRPELFASATIISGPIFDTDQMIDFARNRVLVPVIPTDRIFGPTDDRARIERDDPYRRWRSAADVGAMRIMLAWGLHDRGGIVATSTRFQAHLADHEIPHELLVFDGNHSWISWRPVIEVALRRQLRAGPG